MAQKSTPTVLMYHGIITSPDSIPQNREVGAQLYDVRLKDFREQMNFLKNGGYRVTTFENKSEGASQKPEKKVVLTFDDGEANNFHNAFPVLREFKFPAYFFVTVKRVGTKGYMNWEELKELRDNGIIIGSHGLNHDILINLRDSLLLTELTLSKETLESHLKINVDSFSVPRGFYNEKVLHMALNAGYRNIFVSAAPAFEEPECIGRVAVKSNWSLGRLNQALSHRTPLVEKAGDALKNLAKKILGGEIYNNFRTTLLRK